MTAIIIEDVSQARLDLEALLADYCPQIEVIAHASQANEALEVLASFNPDIVFLDLTLHGVEVIELLKPQHIGEAAVIVTSGNASIAPSVVRPETIAYLSKPIAPLELIRAVELVRTARSTAQSELEHITVSNKDGVHIVPLSSISKLVASNNRTHVHLLASEVPLHTSKTLKTFDFLDNDPAFCRIHHSHIVNLRHVVKYTLIDGGIVTLADGSRLSISKQNFAKFQAKLKARVLEA